MRHPFQLTRISVLMIKMPWSEELLLAVQAVFSPFRKARPPTPPPKKNTGLESCFNPWCSL